MRSNQKSTVSKPRLLRGFQGPVAKNAAYFQGLHPWVRGDHLRLQPHRVSPGSQKPRSVAGVHTAPAPAHAGDRRFSSPTAAAYLLLVRRRPLRTTTTPANSAHSRKATEFPAA
jgi:hypothetical protein